MLSRKFGQGRIKALNNKQHPLHIRLESKSINSIFQETFKNNPRLNQIR